MGLRYESGPKNKVGRGKKGPKRGEKKDGKQWEEKGSW